MTPGTYRSRKPGTGAVPFGLLGIGTASLPTHDGRCCDCLHARRMMARAWRGCAAGHPPYRANDLHHCADWRAVEVTP